MTVQRIDFNDNKAWKFLRTGKTAGVFQFEKEECTDILRRLRINDLNTLVDVNALNRPGPKDAGMVDSYIKRKSGEEEIVYDHPALEPILKDTVGIILFQEQCINIASELAGYSLADADSFRKAISKKDEASLAKERVKFVEGCKTTKNIEFDDATGIFNKIVTFADYGFNKSHSVCYAVLGYWLSYLKANYPIEFMTNLLSAQTAEEEMRKYFGECRNLGLKIDPPHINESKSGFSISKEENTIVFGLSSIKGIGKGVAEYIAKNQPYHGILDFMQRADREVIKMDVVEKLLKAGAFRKADKEFTTKQILENLPTIIKAFKTDKYVTTKNALKVMLKQWTKQMEKRGEKLEFDDLELAHMEREMLGFYVTTHPLRHLPNPEALTNKGYVPLNDLKNAGRKFYTIGVLAKKVKSKKSRKGKIFHELSLEDERATANFAIFDNRMEGLSDLKQGDVIVLLIKKSKERFYPERFRKLNE